MVVTEAEWRGVGVQQSRGWVHYECHRPEPHILLFRRPLGTDPVTGKVVETLARDAKANANANAHVFYNLF